MSALRHHWPSHATVVAYLALFVALGGSGYAASKSGGDQSKTVVVKKAVASKKQDGKKARRGPLARKAQATATASPTAPAYGLVGLDGALSRSLNVASVTKPGTGTYCLKLASGINPTTRTVVASPDFHQDATTFNNSRQSFNSTGDSQAVVEVAGRTGACGIDLTVITGIRYADGRIQRADQGFSFSVPARSASTFAVVHHDGALIAGSPGVTSSKRFTGQYRVELPHDVSSCPVVVSVGGFRTEKDLNVGLPGFAVAHPLVNAVNVDTYNKEGERAVRGFHLIANCPA